MANTKTTNAETAIEEVRTGYHRHTNPDGSVGGWVKDGVSIPETVYVGYWAEIHGGTICGGTIRGGTIRGGTIWGGTIWGGTIRGGTIWGGTIWGGTIWGGTIWGGTIWGGTIRGGTIRGGTWDQQPLTILGSRWPVTNSAPGLITIGCQTHTFAEWQEHGERTGRQNGLTDAQIAEYRVYVEMVISRGVPAEETPAEPAATGEGS